MIRRWLANRRLDAALKLRKIARQIASVRAKKAYWEYRRSIWNNARHKAMRGEG